MKQRLLLSALCVLLLSSPAWANDPLEEYFYASGKIRVVLAVVAVVMVGLFVYLIGLDRRLKRLESKKSSQ